MRFLELNLIAYGPFTDLTLDLSGGKEGLHVILGPNEAGKSTTLRALACLLYDFGHSCPDGYLHGQNKLKVGATVRSSDGSELTFVRRKGRVNTLSDGAGNPLTENALSQLLAGTNKEIFSSRFGIGFQELRAGAAGILADQGKSGPALVTTGLGGLDVRQVLERLDEEALSLFKPRGQNQKVNESLSRYGDIRTRLKSLTTDFEHAKETESAIVRLREELSGIRVELEKLRHEKARLERIQKAIPRLAARHDLIERRAALGEVIALPNDFANRRQSAQQSLEMAEKELKDADSELKRLKEESLSLDVPEMILEVKETIADLYQELGGVSKALHDRPGLIEKRSRLLAQAEQIGEVLAGRPLLEPLLACRLTTNQHRNLDSLAKRHAVLMGERSTISSRISEAAKELAEVHRSVEALPTRRDCGDLRAYVDAVFGAGDLDKGRAELLQSVEGNESQARVEASRLGGWKGTLGQLEAMSLPSLETVSGYAKKFQKMESDDSDLARRCSEAEQKLRRTERSLVEVLRSGEVPMEKDLTEARQRRETGWNLIRRSWLKREDVTREADLFDPTQPLEEAFEDAVKHADEVSDRLRTDAERVARHVSLSAERDDLLQELNRLKTEQSNLQECLQQTWTDWKSVWLELGIDPLSPQEMIGWLAKIPPILQRMERSRGDRLRLGQFEQTIRKYAEGLDVRLAELGEMRAKKDESLRAILIRAKSVVSSIEKTERTREDLQRKETGLKNDLERAQREQEKVDADQGEWEAAWNEAVSVFRGLVEVHPDNVEEVVRRLDEALQKIDEAEELSKRISGIDDDSEQYRTKTLELVNRVSPDLSGRRANEAIQVLHGRLVAAQQAAARREGIQDQMVKTGRKAESAKRTIEEMGKRLSRLMQEAGCDREEDFQAIEERSALFQELSREIETLEFQLRELSPRGDLAELVREAELIDRDSIPGEMQTIEEGIASLEKRNEALNQEIGRNEQVLRAVNGNDEAAREAESAQLLLSSIQTDAQRYIRLRLATEILRSEVERYRRENQGPLLEAAGGILRRISMNSFSGLETDFGSDDEPVILGVRSSGDRLGVDEMSDGARDQLYLSLRLAHLGAFLSDQREPIPLVVDDILVHFDDQRAKETLKILGELSRKTQILFFTHHRHLVDLARTALPDEILFVHSLSPLRAH